MSKELFVYSKPELPDNCIFNISPSQIEKFFTYPKIWYEENILGKEPEFKGSTSSVLGTVCHYIYEQVTLGNIVTRKELDKALDNYDSTYHNPDVNVEEIKKLYPDISTEVVNNYVLVNNTGKIECEKPVSMMFKNNIFVGGTIDRIEKDMVVDYKTVGIKPNTEAIPFGYKIQLLSYAYILRSMGYLIDRIRIVYGVRPTKTLPARCFVVTENISFEDEKLIKDTLNLMTDTILKVKEDPKLAYLLFKSYDLKEK